MSCTEIYGLTKNGAKLIGEIRNSWRGAMAIWQFLEKKYLPPLEFTRCISMDKIDEIWKLQSSPNLTKSERIALLSTFDKVLAKVDSIDQVLFAFRDFSGDSSLKEQADLIEKTIASDPEIIAIGWNQTSVNIDRWQHYKYDEVSDSYTSYNIETQSDHFFLIDYFLERCKEIQGL